MSTQIPVIPSPNELFDRAAERTLELGQWLDEASFAALVDYVRAQLLAAAHVQRGSTS